MMGLGGGGMGGGGMSGGMGGGMMGKGGGAPGGEMNPMATGRVNVPGTGGNMGLDMHRIPIVGNFFQNPYDMFKQQQMQNAAQAYSMYRPEAAQAFMNSQNQQSSNLQGMNNALASMYGSGATQGFEAQNPFGPTAFQRGAAAGSDPQMPTPPGQQPQQPGQGGGTAGDAMLDKLQQVPGFPGFGAPPQPPGLPPPVDAAHTMGAGTSGLAGGVGSAAGQGAGYLGQGANYFGDGFSQGAGALGRGFGALGNWMGPGTNYAGLGNGGWW